MEIKDLQSGQGKVDVEVSVKSKEDPRTFNKYGKDLKVCNAIVSDSSGEIVLSLWNDDVDKVNVGDKVRITNGYVSEFNGKKQLTSGKYGKMEVIGSGSSGSSEEKTAKKAVKKEIVEDDEVAF